MSIQLNTEQTKIMRERTKLQMWLATIIIIIALLYSIIIYDVTPLVYVICGVIGIAVFVLTMPTIFYALDEDNKNG